MIICVVIVLQVLNACCECMRDRVRNLDSYITIERNKYYRRKIELGKAGKCGVRKQDESECRFCFDIVTIARLGVGKMRGRYVCTCVYMCMIEG